MDSRKPGSQHNAALDGLRGVAAMAVVWYHMTYQAYGVPTPFRGYLSVDFFFILSGLVVARAYEQRLQGSMSLLDFARVRVIRLWPLIVLGIAVGAGSKLLAVHHGGLPACMLFGLFLLPFTGMYGAAGDMFPLDPPLWSLMFEVWANVLYAAVAALRKQRLLSGFIYAAIVLGAGGDVVCAIYQHNLTGGFNMLTFGTGLARVSCAFFIGVALNRILTPVRIARLPSIPFPVLVIALLAVLSAGAGFGWFYDLFAVLIAFPAIVVLGAKDCAVGRMRKIALFSGAISYPVYVLHEPTFAHFTHFHGRSLAVTLTAFIAAFFAILAVSYVVLRWYDEPIRTWLTQITRRKLPGVSAALQAKDRLS